MLTRYEQFAVTQMMGKPGTPPRANGALCFGAEWERTAFGMALALAREGWFEWDDFQAALIAQIAAWETADPGARGDWDYYECWLSALENTVAAAGIADPDALAARLTRGSPEGAEPRR
ncbi:nitrile hydratase accessory protein [Acuticoccus sediminis]|uniref:nitrile hydratase accessory protein n=1 Tax=Acuticoccus sediminis TaxID=2184697 RepID=UPI001CFDB73E|nr:nitrile hydratase accessory protein [Acuticoccus sediminis]